MPTFCRLKMGICEGSPRAILPDELGRADYHGASIKQAECLMDAGKEGLGGHALLPVLVLSIIDSRLLPSALRATLLTAAHGGQVACDATLAARILTDWEVGCSQNNGPASSFYAVSSPSHPRPGSIGLRNPSAPAEPAPSQARIDSSAGSAGAMTAAATARSVASERLHAHSTVRLALATYSEEEDEEPLSSRRGDPDPPPPEPTVPLDPGASLKSAVATADVGARASSWLGGSPDGLGSEHGLDSQSHALSAAPAHLPEPLRGAGVAVGPGAIPPPFPTTGDLQAGAGAAVGEILAVHAGVFRYEGVSQLRCLCCPSRGLNARASASPPPSPDDEVPRGRPVSSFPLPVFQSPQ